MLTSGQLPRSVVLRDDSLHGRPSGSLDLGYARAHGSPTAVQVRLLRAGSARVREADMPFGREAEFRRAEATARSQRRGYWAACAQRTD